MAQVRALYDFEAQPGSGELKLRAGEILMVTMEDAGDGWSEGINAQGVRGLYPSSYVEKVAMGGPPAMPPPPLPENVVRRQSQVQSLPQAQPPLLQQPNNDYGSTVDPLPSRNSFTASFDQRTLSNASSQQKPNQRPSGVGGGGDDFDDDFSRSDDESTFDQAEPTEPALEGGTGRLVTTGGGVKKSMNRFSRFVQSGMEAFILNQVKISSPPQQDLFEVTLTNIGPKWSTNPQNQYTCRLSSFKKTSKMKGLKSFINYELTPSFASHNSVERRYKHFEWLHSRLESKFTFMLLPPLPERQTGGRSEDELVEHRMHLLQMWIDKICRHPVMSRADVWMHFLTTPPDGKEWKNGKRKAEKDAYVGGNFFFSISPPSQQLDPGTVEQRFDIFSRKAKSLDEAVKSASIAASESIKQICGPFRSEFSKYASAFRTLSQAMADEAGTNSTASQLAIALGSTGDKYDAIAKMCLEEPKTDFEPLLDQLFVYRGMLSSVPRCVQAEKNVLASLREHQKLAEDGKMAPAELEVIRSRVDTVSYAMLSEVNHFESEHVRDMKSLVKDFLFAQMTFYDNVRKELQEAVQLFS